METLHCDYLIVGSGAMGMAFADTLLSETNANIMIVDQHHKPGGHWNVAYPFVTLHQPSSFYGVSSRELSKGCKDEVGLNKGLNELASGAEVSAYFDNVMREQFLPSGRIQYFPMCKYTGNGQFESILNGKQYQVDVKQKTVDCTYLKTTAPSTHTPNFTVADGVSFMPINDLPKIDAPPGYVIIGGGKTGIDAVLFLLEKGVNPEHITWIMPRDAWLLDRENTQASEEFFHSSIGAQAKQMEAIAQSDSIHDMFSRLEKSGVFLRIDKTVWPCMFHGATVSKMELALLQQVRNIIRLGRVKTITQTQIILEQGSIDTTAHHVHVDCSASAITNLTIKPIFQGDLITPQTVRSYQPVFSAAFIAHVEASYPNDDLKNTLCHVVPLPNTDIDWLRLTAAFLRNQHVWGQDPNLREWLLNNRLDGFSKLVRGVKEDETDKLMILKRMKENGPAAMAKLQAYLGQVEQA